MIKKYRKYTATIEVKSYNRKDGTRVKAHARINPKYGK